MDLLEQKSERRLGFHTILQEQILAHFTCVGLFERQKCRKRCLLDFSPCLLPVVMVMVFGKNDFPFEQGHSFHVQSVAILSSALVALTISIQFRHPHLSHPAAIARPQIAQANRTHGLSTQTSGTHPRPMN